MTGSKKTANFAIKHIGQPVKRVEDPMLLTGKAQCVGDLTFPGMLHVAMVRSPHAHAKIVSIDVSEALKVPGVEKILTGEEFKEHCGPAFGWDLTFQNYAIAVGKVAYVGEVVAAVAACSRAVAEDVAELIAVEYEPLPPVLDPHKALDPDAPIIREGPGTNRLFQKTWTHGDPAGELARADVVVQGSFRFPRVSANCPETNGCVARFDPVAGLTVWHNNVRSVSRLVSMHLGLPPDSVQSISQPRGASFGSRGASFRNIMISSVLSKLCDGRHVKYIEDRLEHLNSSISQSWDRHYTAEFGFTRDGKCTVMKIKLLNDSGASSEGLSPTQTLKPIVVFTGPYRVEHAEYEVTAVITNKDPEGTYRGYGPPPHIMVQERMMDLAAAQLGLDPAEIRRRNFIQPDEFPYTSVLEQEYDSGNYPLLLETALEKSGYAELRKEQERLRAEGRLVGLSVVFGLEPGGAWGMPGPYLDFGLAGGMSMPEAATISVDMMGLIFVDLYFHIEGQGQWTFAAQLVADYFGVPMSVVRVRHADSRHVPPTFGPGGSRMAVTLPNALIGAADGLRDKLAAVAAKMLNVPVEALELHEGAFRVKEKPDVRMMLAQIAGAMAMKPAEVLSPGVDGNPHFTYSWARTDKSSADPKANPYITTASACHVVWLEIERGTGKVTIKKYVLVDDCGTRLNPAIVEGQTQGALAQGLGCALLEEHVYDDNGQPLCTTYMDYLLPSIFDVPMTETYSICTPSPWTALGQKGTGEGAIHLTPGAIFCAINDALSPLGVEITQAPATPDRLWRLIKWASDGPAGLPQARNCCDG